MECGRAAGKSLALQPAIFAEKRRGQDGMGLLIGIRRSATALFAERKQEKLILELLEAATES